MQEGLGVPPPEPCEDEPGVDESVPLAVSVPHAMPASASDATSPVPKRRLSRKTPKALAF